MRLGDIRENRFISNRREVTYEQSSIIYIPIYSGRNKLDEWIRDEGGKLEIGHDYWRGWITLGNINYALRVKFIDVRTEDDKENVFEAIMSKRKIICDERLSVRWRNKRDMDRKLFEAITGENEFDFKYELFDKRYMVTNREW